MVECKAETEFSTLRKLDTVCEFQEKEMKNEITRKDLEIEDLRTHLETLLDEEEREKRLSSGSDCKFRGMYCLSLSCL